MKKTINYKFKKYNSLGKEELYAAQKVIKSGNLSGFLVRKVNHFWVVIMLESLRNMLKNFTRPNTLSV